MNAQLNLLKALEELRCEDHISGVDSQHTLDHTDCPPCIAAWGHALRNDPDSLLNLPFSSAATKWLATRKPYLKERSFYMAGHHIEQLKKFFGAIVIDKMHIGHVRQYQIERMANTGQRWKRPAGASLIKHELCIVQQILKRAGVWKKRFSDDYEKIPMPSTKPKRVMSEEEKKRLFRVASNNPDWAMGYSVAMITYLTSAAGTELRHLKFQDLFLDNPYPTFLIPAEYCKNDNRGRRIFVNETCMQMFRIAIDLANKKGSSRPEHFLFPKRVVRGLYDPWKPCSTSWLRNQFHDMTEAADLRWVTPHCLRHQCITELFEQGHSLADIQSITGQLSPQSVKIYCHNRIERQRSILVGHDPLNKKPVQSARIGASRREA